jgi:hypothetical protein
VPAGIFLGLLLVGLGPAVGQGSTYPPGNWKTIIENKDFTSTLYLEGPASDDTLVIGCTFHDIVGSAIRISNVSNVSPPAPSTATASP